MSQGDKPLSSMVHGLTGDQSSQRDSERADAEEELEPQNVVSQHVQFYLDDLCMQPLSFGKHSRISKITAVRISSSKRSHVLSCSIVHYSA